MYLLSWMNLKLQNVKKQRGRLYGGFVDVDVDFQKYRRYVKVILVAF